MKNHNIKAVLFDLDGVVAFIQKMRTYGTKIALCSSSKNASIILEKLGLVELFDVIITGHDVENAKPHPEIFLLASKKLKVPAFHCVVFEDAVVGIQAAKSAEMRNVGVGNHKGIEQSLLLAMAIWGSVELMMRQMRIFAHVMECISMVFMLHDRLVVHSTRLVFQNATNLL